jgi:hypothetical protein
MSRNVGYDRILSDMGDSRWAGIAGLAAVGGLALGLAVLAGSGPPEWRRWLFIILVAVATATLFFALAWTALVVVKPVWSWRRAPLRRGSGTKRDPHKVADRLAKAVKAQWEYEAEWRRIFNPYALPVRWVAADPALFATWPALVKHASGSPGGSAEMAATWAAGPDELVGDDNDLADVLDRVPTRRLVVLGEPGAGKTVLLVRLVLELLSPDRRQEGGPVPILLPVASWNPTIEDLHSWIVHWLATDPAGLAQLTPDGPSMARELLEAGLILPVLDGFDEIPDEVRGSAIAKINEAIKPCPGLILAARTKAYRAAVHEKDGTGIVLSGAAGIELRPLDANIVTEYLKEADGPAAAVRWDPVIATLRADDPPPVAQALTTPLMVTLARAIYNPRDNEGAEAVQHQPAELLNRVVSLIREAVDNYLFDKFIWAAYRPHPNPSHPSRRYPWNYEQAKRWLVFLARTQEIRENGTPDIAWWKLPRAAPRYLVAIVLAAILAVIAAVGYPFVGFGVGVTTGILIGVGARLRKLRRVLPPAHLRSYFRKHSPHVLQLLFFGL